VGGISTIVKFGLQNPKENVYMGDLIVDGRISTEVCAGVTLLEIGFTVEKMAVSCREGSVPKVGNWPVELAICAYQLRKLEDVRRWWNVIVRR
jgi:hypothetical protein